MFSSRAPSPMLWMISGTPLHDCLSLTMPMCVRLRGRRQVTMSPAR